MNKLASCFLIRMASQVRQNFHEQCEAAINKQINMELYQSYVFTSMAWYFDRDDVGLPGLHKFFLRYANEEREHAEELLEYQNKRGGRIVMQDIKKPEKDEWGSALEAMEYALQLEKGHYRGLMKCHEFAEKHGDKEMMSFIENEFLHEEVEFMKKLGDHIANLKRVGKGLGEYQFDKMTLEQEGNASD